MKLHATGGTNFGELALYWPELLPSDFDVQFAGNPDELIEKLRDEGKLILFRREVNGEVHLGLFVNEPVPDQLERHCTLATKIEALRVAGEGYFCGGEFLFRGDRSLLDQHARMGTAVQIPAGTYFAEVFTTEIPDAVYETWLQEEAGEGAQRLWWVQTWFASVGIVSLMMFVGCLFFGTRTTVLATGTVSAVLLAIAWLLSRSASYRRVQQARRDYDVAYPDFVVRLRSLANE